MRYINPIVKILTFTSAWLKGFWEQLLCKIMGTPVENKKLFQFNEMAGHIEHEPFATSSKSFWFCFVSGFMVFLFGVLLAIPAIFNLLYLDVSSLTIRTMSISMLFGAASVLTNIFPSVEDALMMWENYKKMGKAAKIILAPAAAIMYVGAYAETWGITFLTNHALAALVLFL